MSENTTPNNSQNSTKVIAGIVILLVIIGAVLYSSNSKRSSQNGSEYEEPSMQDPQKMEDLEGDGSWGDLDVAKPADSSTTPETQNNQNINPSTSPSSYKDGEYNVTGTYTSPAGSEQVKVTLTLKSGKVISTKFEGLATNAVSIKMQKNFNEGYQAQVVGKSIDEVQLGVVNGSSLTPKGFMNALEKIKSQAKT